LLVSNIEYIKKANEENACNAVLLKLNQVGTVTELIASANLAKKYGWKTIVSHRSGETTDDFISDLAVGIDSDYMKSGAPARGERVCNTIACLK
jgi:enolase